MINEFNARIFDELQDFAEVSGCISELERELPTLSRVIVSHGVQDLVCVTLLHKHFDLKAGEKLVEELNESGSTLTPQSLESHFLVPCLWKVNDVMTDFPEKGFDPLEFIRKDRPEGRNALLQVTSLLEKRAFLSEFASTIRENDLVGTFGLSLVRREHLLPKSDEYLLESTDEAKRMLTFAVRKINAIKATNVVPTMWRFGANGQVSHCGHCGHPVH